MSRRTIEAYESALQYIHEHLIPLKGNGIIIDFEKGLRKGLKKVLGSNHSEMPILGCWFHMTQARRKLTKQSNLFEKVQTEETYKDIFRRFQCLALLPLHHIESMFKILSKEALKLDKDCFSPFINYFHNEWIKVVTPYHFCVYMRGSRTTAIAEAFNGVVNKLFKTHGSFFSFVETLQKVEVSSATQLENYINGTQQKDNRSSFYKKRSKLINKLWTEYKDNPRMLLKVLANPKNKVLYADNEITIEAEDTDLATSDYSMVMKMELSIRKYQFQMKVKTKFSLNQDHKLNPLQYKDAKCRLDLGPELHNKSVSHFFFTRDGIAICVCMCLLSFCSIHPSINLIQTIKIDLLGIICICCFL